LKSLKEFWNYIINSIKEADKNDALIFLFLAFVLILSHAIGEPSFFRKRFTNSFEDKAVLRLCSVFYRQVMAFITGFLLPFLFFTLIIKKKPSSLGVSMGDKERGFFFFSYRLPLCCLLYGLLQRVQVIRGYIRHLNYWLIIGSFFQFMPSGNCFI
jgi:hypothetical protein